MNIVKDIRYIFVNLCRLAVSATFIFSGLVKLIDPVGTQYKIEDYAVAMSLDGVLSSPTPLALAVILAIAEFCLGVYLFFGIRRRITTYTILGLMLVYTPLTLWLAISNAVADCGCFGDAVVLTNWQTFWKNAFLLLAALVLFRHGNLLTRFISEPVQWLISLYSVIYSGFLTALCLYGEPIIDFRPFHIGQNIPAAMVWPDDPEQVPEIIDFYIEPLTTDADLSHPSSGIPSPCPDTETLLADTSYTFLLIAPRLETADDANMERINALYDYARSGGYSFWCLTASGSEAISRWQDLTGAEYGFGFVDELTLKTMARSNPAIILLHNGTIVAKMGHRQLPDIKTLSGALQTQPWAKPQPRSYRRLLLNLLLWYIVPLLVLTFFDRLVASIRWWHKKKTAQKQKKTNL